MEARFVAHTTDCTGALCLQSPPELVLVGGEVVTSCSPPENSNLGWNLGLPNELPNTPRIISSFVAPGLPPNTIVKVISEFICTSHKKITITLIMPRFEVLAGMNMEL
jgi:hypothetical protein